MLTLNGYLSAIIGNGDICVGAVLELESHFNGGRAESGVILYLKVAVNTLPLICVPLI